MNNSNIDSDKYSLINSLISDNKKIDLIKLFNSETESHPEVFQIYIDILHQMLVNKEFINFKILCDIMLVGYPCNPQIVTLVNKLGNNKYWPDFYEGIYLQSYNTAKVFLSEFFNFYQPKSIIDIGCGTGQWLNAAKDLGYSNLVGVDFDAQSSIHKNHFEFIKHDLNTHLNIPRSYDLAMTVEVAEHLNPERSESFVADLVNLSEVIIFAAALPRQSGDYHINCKPHSYWKKIFLNHNYRCFDFFRPRFWSKTGLSENYVQNTFVYIKESHPLAQTLCNDFLMDVYHPKMINNSFIIKDHNQ